VGGTIAGVLLITLIDNVLILVGVPSVWRTMVLGGFILLAGLFYAWVDSVARRT
jgi:simple sugar transport system permease protein